MTTILIFAAAAVILFLVLKRAQYVLRQMAKKNASAGNTSEPRKNYGYITEPKKGVFSSGGGKILRIFLVMLPCLLLAWSSFYIIPVGNRGVVFRLGDIKAVADQGVGFKIPFVDRVVVVNTEQIRRFEYGYRTVDREATPGNPGAYKNVPQESKMLTGDNKIVEIDWVLQYQVGDPVQYSVNLPKDENERNMIVRDMSEAVLREVIASRSLDDVLTTEKESSQTEAKKLIQEKLDALETGVFIVAVQFQDVAPPQAVQAAFSDINTARSEKERLILEAEKYSNEVIQKAEGEAERILNEAEAYAFRRISLAEGEAARMASLGEAYKTSPDLVRFNLWLETMKDVWNTMDITVVEVPKGSVSVLPLEKMLPAAGGRKTSASGTVPADDVVIPARTGGKGGK